MRLQSINSAKISNPAEILRKMTCDESFLMRSFARKILSCREDRLPRRGPECLCNCHFGISDAR